MSSMPAGAASQASRRLSTAICLNGILWREFLRFLHQRGRFFAALVRPLVWLFIFAAGFRAVLGVSIIPPYETYILYEVYITPGLVGDDPAVQRHAIVAVDGLRPRDGLDARAAGQPVAALVPALSKLVAGVPCRCCRSMSSSPSPGSGRSSRRSLGYLTVLPALMLAGLMLGALGLLLSSVIRQLENFAGVMNFVIFPMFFASLGALPAVADEGSEPAALSRSASLNPFTHAVELIRFALYGQLNSTALAVLCGCTALFMVGAVLATIPRAASGPPRRAWGTDMKL